MDTRVAGLTARRDQDRLEPADAASRIRHWGFLANPDLPDRPGPAYLLVALRAAPSLRHYDPESVDYWVTEVGRGAVRRRRSVQL